MNSFRRILVLQDDSPQCPVWTRQAAELAGLWNACLLGLHVEPKVVRRNYYDSSVGDGLEQVQNSVEKTREGQVLDRFDEVLAGVRRPFELDDDARRSGCRDPAHGQICRSGHAGISREILG